MEKTYSNEIVFRGHPDKVCDQISAAILDECLAQDENSRCGIETLGGKGMIVVTGEVTTNAVINVQDIVKRVLKDVGYSQDYKIVDNLGKQSADIALGTNDVVGGAGDNGMMFGYACDETKKMLPLAMTILQEFAKDYDLLRKKDLRFYPDGKAQITGIYEDGYLKKIKTFTICYQNCETEREQTDEILKRIALGICDRYDITVDEFLINPTGKFNIGGFEGDAGLTGRKIVVDAYQSFANVGGGCMNGKDPSKVDISGAYIAREFAKEILLENQLRWCEVQISYAIGKKEPLAIYINSDKGEILPDKEMFARAQPSRIISELDMKHKNFEELAQFGHFR